MAKVRAGPALPRNLFRFGCHEGRDERRGPKHSTQQAERVLLARL